MIKCSMEDESFPISPLSVQVIERYIKGGYREGHRDQGEICFLFIHNRGTKETSAVCAEA